MLRRADAGFDPRDDHVDEAPARVGERRALFADSVQVVVGPRQLIRATPVAGSVLLVAGVSLLSHVIQIAYREPRRGMTVRRLPAPAVLSIVTPLALMVWVSVAPPQQFRTVLDDAVAVLDGR
jgi:hypothetical protein